MISYGSKRERMIYYAAPFFLKNLLASAYGVVQRCDRYGRSYREARSFLQAAQYWSRDELEAYSWNLAREFVRRALASVPYYRRTRHHSRVDHPSDLPGIPVLSKNEVRDHLQQFCADDLKRIPHRWRHTSGTTGKSLVFPLSHECFQREYAFRVLHYSWGGVDFAGRDKIALCAGHPVAFYDRMTPPFWVHDFANNCMLLSSYHLTNENLPHYIAALERFQPVMIGGYPSSVYLLALAYQKHGRGTLRLRSVFTASETLFDRQRRTIASAFGAKVFNWYGNSEMCANIVECEQGELHLKLEHSYVEILNAEQAPCRPGETGRLVCTGFGNEAFPLLRYDVGDVVTLSKNQTPKCGRGGRLIDEVIGRMEDYVVTPDGRFVGRLDHLFKDSRHVKEAQIVQNRIDELVVRLVTDEAYGARDEGAIREEGRLRLGSSIALRFEYVDQLPRSRNGKTRFIESSLNQQELLAQLVGQS
jgi:phenylacetate-CoA ligase